jgi:hypothetical protein
VVEEQGAVQEKASHHQRVAWLITTAAAAVTTTIASFSGVGTPLLTDAVSAAGLEPTPL